MAEANLGARLEKTLAIENPGVGDEMPGFFTRNPLELTEVMAVLQGGTSPSVDYNINYSTDRADGTPTQVFTVDETVTSETTGDAITGAGLNNPSIPAGSFVWLEITAVTLGVNRVDLIEVTLIGELS